MIVASQPSVNIYLQGKHVAMITLSSCFPLENCLGMIDLHHERSEDLKLALSPCYSLLLNEMNDYHEKSKNLTLDSIPYTGISAVALINKTFCASTVTVALIQGWHLFEGGAALEFNWIRQLKNFFF